MPALISADSEATLSAQMPGKITKIRYAIGQTFPAGGFPLEIVAVGQGSTPRGVWLFKLTNASG